MCVHLRAVEQWIGVKAHNSSPVCENARLLGPATRGEHSYVMMGPVVAPTGVQLLGAVKVGSVLVTVTLALAVARAAVVGTTTLAARGTAVRVWGETVTLTSPE